jgi:hypothetical protein
LAGFELGSSVPLADAMTTPPTTRHLVAIVNFQFLFLDTLLKRGPSIDPYIYIIYIIYYIYIFLDVQHYRYINSFSMNYVTMAANNNF